MAQWHDQLDALRGATDQELAAFARRNFLSYRLPDIAKNDRWIGFKVVYRVLRKKCSEEAMHLFDPQSSALVITGNAKSVELRKEYLKSFNIGVHSVLVKDELASAWRQVGGLKMAALIVKGLVNAMALTHRSRQRANRALWFTEAIELAVLKNWLATHRITSIHDFSQFEVDANQVFLDVKSFQPEVRYFKYPSPGPLKLHNAILLTDVLCINSPYHREELRSLKGLIRFEELQMIPPEQYLSYRDQIGAYRDDKPNHIGYYSHGSWVRSLRGDASDGLEIGRAEELLIKELAVFMEGHQNVELTIFLHPLERNLALAQERTKHYQRLLEFQGRVRFSDTAHGSSTQQFDRVDVGVGVYSTILFERLFCGGKTLIMSPVQDFPIMGSTLNHITVPVADRGELHVLMDRSLSQSTEAFFAENKLKDYCFKEIQTNLPHD